MPRPVSLAQELLYCQASIWGLISGGCLTWSLLAITRATSNPGPWLITTALIAAAVAGVLAAAKARLGYWIPRGTDRTRQAVVRVEFSMACLGALATIPAMLPEGGGIYALAALVGGGLSLAAAIGLEKPPAREYFAAPGTQVAQSSVASQPDGERSAQFRHIRPNAQWRRQLACAVDCGQ